MVVRGVELCAKERLERYKVKEDRWPGEVRLVEVREIECLKG